MYATHRSSPWLRTRHTPRWPLLLFFWMFLERIRAIFVFSTCPTFVPMFPAVFLLRVSAAKHPQLRTMPLESSFWATSLVFPQSHRHSQIMLDPCLRSVECNATSRPNRWPVMSFLAGIRSPGQRIPCSSDIKFSHFPAFLADVPILVRLRRHSQPNQILLRTINRQESTTIKAFAKPFANNTFPLKYQRKHNIFSSCKEQHDQHQQILAGGGYRFCALLLALFVTVPISLISTKAEAAEFTTPSCADGTTWTEKPASLEYPITVSGQQWKIDPLSNPKDLLSFTLTQDQFTYTPRGTGDPVHTFLSVADSETSDSSTSLTLNDVKYCKSSSGESLIKAELKNGAITSTDIIRMLSDGIMRHYVTTKNAKYIRFDHLYKQNVGDYLSETTGSSLIAWETIQQGFKTEYTNYSAIKADSLIVMDVTPSFYRAEQVMHAGGYREYSPVLLNANGGTYPDGGSIRKQNITYGDSGLDSLPSPTKNGMQIKSWNTKADGTGYDVNSIPPDTWKQSTNTDVPIPLYAQWEKASSKPVKARIACNESYCSVAVSYADTPGVSRMIPVSSFNWGGAPIPGVRLDDKGYDVHTSCRAGSSENYCYNVSLSEPSGTSSVSYNAQMPTTGAPEGLSNIGLLALGLSIIGLATVLFRRQRA